jgi:ectoine hydroxylase-related dioxygenase (phytanoyl-CoA dioxygenase family)
VLTEEQVTQYHADGYTVVRGLYAREHVDAMRGDIDRFLSGEKQPGTIPFTESLDDDPTFKSMSMLSWLAQSSEPLRRALHQRETLEIVSQLLGPDVSWWWDQAAVKAPLEGGEFPWHQDNGYESAEPPLTLNVVIAVDDVTTENGCLWVLPGSHEQGDLEHWEKPPAWHRHCYDGPDQGVPLEGKAGDAAILHCQCVHRSTPNTTPKPRRTYLAAYCSPHIHKKADGSAYEGKRPLLVGGEPAPEVAQDWA